MGGVQRKIQRLHVFDENTLRYTALQGEISSWSLSACTCCVQVSIFDVSVLAVSVLIVMSSPGCLVWEQCGMERFCITACWCLCKEPAQSLLSASVGSSHDIYI